MVSDKRTEYYNDWDKYAVESDKAEKHEEELHRKQQDEALMANQFGPRRRGYVFRTGHETPFPEIINMTGESDQQSAWRVAGELREKGKIAFADASVCGAQSAADFWAQGILALERLKNLRKYQPAKEPEKLRTELDKQEFWESWAAQGGSEYKLADVPLERDGPSDDEAAALKSILRLNLAQALLDLRDPEACIRCCDAVLIDEPCNTKALWRRAKAAWATRNPGLAQESAETLLKTEPDNAAAKQLLHEIEVEEARLKVKQSGQRPPSRRHGMRLLDTGHRFAEPDVCSRPRKPEAACDTAEAACDTAEVSSPSLATGPGAWRCYCCTRRKAKCQ